MSDPAPTAVVCPRCGSQDTTVCGKSMQLTPEVFPNQPLAEREQVTLAYRCTCGMAFTKTIERSEAPPVVEE